MTIPEHLVLKDRSVNLYGAKQDIVVPRKRSEASGYTSSSRVSIIVNDSEQVIKSNLLLQNNY